MSAVIPNLKIKTAHSEYLIDQNAGTVTRTPVHELANRGIRVEAKAYYGIVSGLKPGERLHIDYADGSWTLSTPIVSVEEVAPETKDETE